MKRLFIALLMVLPIATAFSQNITTAEYFFDADPGPGNGKPISVGSPSALVNFTASIPLNNLSPGFHWLGVRTKDADGKWGLFDRRDFYIGQTTGDMPIIIAAEYFYDHDPGVGSGAAIPILNPGLAISKIFDIPVPAGMSAGTHWLTIRMKDQTGHWGLFQRDSIKVGATTATITCPGNVTVNPYTNDCKAVVFNIDAVGLPSNDSSYTYTLTGATTGNGIGTASGKWFNAGVTTVKYAPISSPTVSCSFTVTVNSSVTPTVAISTSNTPICEGTLKSFSSIYTNAGSSTTIWQWKKNGINVGTNSAIYRDSTLQNNDTITLAMTSAISCAVPQTVTSAPVTVTVYPRVIPSVSITASATSICPGQSVTFTALATNGGSQPIFQWVKNGVLADLGSVYQTSSLANGDSVYVILYNTTDCIPNSEIISNVIHITIVQTVTPSVSIIQSPTTICSGTIVTYTASPVNGGSTPAYQWKVNDINVGNNSNTYTPSTLVNGNVVKVIMTSSLGCASSPSATSNSITMIVNDSLQESVSITASATTICAGTSVTFTAAESGGGSGTFQWKLNGNNVGTNSLVYRSDSLHNGDKVKVVMTPSYACSPSLVTSNEITMTVNSSTPSVSILASTTNICAGQQVTFTATPVNGGATPSYQWKLNGNNVGTNSPTYQNAALQNGDSVKVAMTSSLASVCQLTALSNSITMSVGQAVTPSVSIISTATTICNGQPVTFTATPTNGGNTPHYEWMLNGNEVGTNSATYQNSALSNGDTVKVFMTTSLSCASQPLAVSNTITITVGESIPSVTITASDPSVCSGTLVTFTATPTNGGNPAYQWKLNGNNVGTNSATYQNSALANNDTVKVLMTSSLTCASQPTVTSNSIIMWVGQTVTPSVTIAASATTICSGEQVTFTATPVNGGVLFNSATPVGIGPPSYQWKLNGNNVGNNSSTYQSSTLVNGDVVTVEMTSGFPCASPATVSSNAVTITVTSLSTFYRDLDGDGYGNSNSGTTRACTAPAGYVSNNTDCNDNPATGGITINPGHAEVCGNGVDDNCNGTIDENCTTNLPVLTLRTYPAKEGDAGQTVLNVTVTLDTIAPAPVSVNYATANEDATAGLDYVATSGVLVIPAGSLSGTIQVRIIGDLLREANEHFRVNFTNPVNVSISSDPYSRIMIIDDDKGKNNAVASIDKIPVEDEQLKIPSVAQCNQVWFIQRIGNYENEVSILNTQGQLVTRFVNYRNQTPLTNLPTGLYFYRILLKEGARQGKYYTGRLMITQ